MKEWWRSRLPQFEKSVFGVSRYQVLMRVVRYANHVFLVHLQPEVKVQNMHNCSRTVRYGKAENTSPTVIVRSSFPEAALKQYKTISSPTQYTHSPRGDTTAHRKSPPSRLPDEKLRTIWDKSRTYGTIRKRTDTYLLSYLSLHVHDDDCIGAVADDKLFGVSR